MDASYWEARVDGVGAFDARNSPPPLDALDETHIPDIAFLLFLSFANRTLLMRSIFARLENTSDRFPADGPP